MAFAITGKSRFVILTMDGKKVVQADLKESETQAMRLAEKICRKQATTVVVCAALRFCRTSMTVTNIA